MNIQTDQKTGLREQKAAKLKLKIMDLFVEKLKEKPFGEISVDEICHLAMISKVTFFNYFPSKDNVLDYMSAIWTFKLKMGAKQNKYEGMKAIEYLFQITPREIFPNRDLAVNTIAAIVARKLPADRKNILTIAEKLELFPGSDPAAFNFSERMGDYFLENLKYATDWGEIKSDLPFEDIVILVAGMYHGCSHLASRPNIMTSTEAYERSFGLLKKILNYSSN